MATNITVTNKDDIEARQTKTSGFKKGAASYGLIRKFFGPSATLNGLRKANPYPPKSVAVQHNISKPR